MDAPAEFFLCRGPSCRSVSLAGVLKTRMGVRPPSPQKPSSRVTPADRGDHQRWCRACMRAYDRLRRQSLGPAARGIRTKLCNGPCCEGDRKLLTEFHRLSNSRHHTSWHGRQAFCKECMVFVNRLNRLYHKWRRDPLIK